MNAKINGASALRRIGGAVVAMGLVGLVGLLAACGGGNDSPPAAAAPPAAVITAQPADQSAVVGRAATFSVTATNATGYQWQRSSDGGATFADVAGATATSHTTAATALLESGAQYRVVVAGAGAANRVTSSAATLTVTAAAVAPSISVQPAAQAVTAGQSASFSVTAAGTALTYQWQRSTDGGATFTDEAGATAATLTLSAVAQSQSAHLLRVVVSNSLGSVTSTGALLTVNAATAAAAFTQHPVSQSVTAPAVAIFTVAASGTPAPTLQWQVNAGPGWDDIIGATAASYTTPATALSDNGKRFRVMATNVTATGTALITSNAATLTVGAATMPSFTTQPASMTISAGQNAQFTVAVSGTPTPSLQWQLSTDGGVNWGNIVGETGAVFNVTGAALDNNGRQFRAVASNSAGTINSSAAGLAVNAVPAGASIVFTRGFGIQSAPNDLLLIKEDGSGETSLAVTTDDELFLGMAPGGRIVYQRISAGQSHFYSVSADGTGTVRLVSPASATDLLNFHGITPSGWVIYSQRRSAAVIDLYAVKADGTGSGPVTLAASGGKSSFSVVTPSGKVVYQVETTFDQYDMFSVNADGTGKVALAAATDRPEGWAGYLSAGQIVIYSCNFFDSGLCDYLSVNENGGAGSLLARDTFAGQYKVEGVTKTGRVIVSGSSVQFGDRSLYIDGTSTLLVGPPDIKTYVGSTADGRVVYQRLVPLPNSNFRTDLSIVNADGTNVRVLATDAAFLSAAPDGRIIYTTFANGLYRVKAVNADGTGAVTLGNSPNTFQDFFQGMTANGRVIFSQENGSASGLSLFAVNTYGTGVTLLAVRSFFVANTPSGKVLLRNQDTGNANLSIVNPDGTGLTPLANTGNNEFFNAAFP